MIRLHCFIMLFYCMKHKMLSSFFAGRFSTRIISFWMWKISCASISSAPKFYVNGAEIKPFHDYEMRTPENYVMLQRRTKYTSEQREKKTTRNNRSTHREKGSESVHGGFWPMNLSNEVNFDALMLCP